MKTSKSPAKAYENVYKETMSGRALEAHVLRKAAAAMKECQERWDESIQFDLLDEALRYNQHLWTILQIELSDIGNPLPKELRQDLLNLSGFIDKRTIDTLSYPEKHKLDILININLNLAEGLSVHH